jgi:hypothetical protein
MDRRDRLSHGEARLIAPWTGEVRRDRAKNRRKNHRCWPPTITAASDRLPSITTAHLNL